MKVPAQSGRLRDKNLFFFLNVDHLMCDQWLLIVLLIEYKSRRNSIRCKLLIEVPTKPLQKRPFRHGMTQQNDGSFLMNGIQNVMVRHLTRHIQIGVHIFQYTTARSSTHRHCLHLGARIMTATHRNLDVLQVEQIFDLFDEVAQMQMLFVLDESTGAASRWIRWVWYDWLDGVATFSDVDQVAHLVVDTVFNDMPGGVG